MEAEPRRLKKRWAAYRRGREEVRLRDAESIRGFEAHAARVRATLTGRGISVPATLCEDPSYQSKLMTWLEYQAAVYWRQEELVRAKEEKKKKLAYKALDATRTSTEWTTSQKTREYLDAQEHSFLLEEESRAEFIRDPARKDLDRFEGKLEAKGGLPGIPRAAIDARLKFLRDRARMEEKHYEIVSRPRREFSKYRDAKVQVTLASESADHPACYVQWVKNQVPLIQTEIGAPVSTPGRQAAPDTGLGRGSSSQSLERADDGESRKRSTAEPGGDEEQQQTSKRVKRP